MTQSRFGIRMCPNCLSFGIKLSVLEFQGIQEAIKQGRGSDHIVQRKAGLCAPCQNCGGLGWEFARDYPRIELPAKVWERW